MATWGVAVALVLLCSMYSSDAVRRIPQEVATLESMQDQQASLMMSQGDPLRQGALVQLSNSTNQTAEAASKTLVQQIKQAGEDVPNPAPSCFGNVIMQLIGAFIFSATVASKYPQLEQVSDRSKEIMQESTVCRCNFGAICVQSFCFGPSMLGLLTSKVGLCDFWPGALASMCFPCCVLLWLRSFSEFNVKMGGMKDDPMQGCMLSCFCAPCTIARNVEALDAATGATIGCCSFTGGTPPAVYVGQPAPMYTPHAQASAPAVS